MHFNFFPSPEKSGQTILCMYNFLIRMDEDTRNVLRNVSRSTRNAIESIEKDTLRPFPVLPTISKIPQFNQIPPHDISVSTLSGGMTNITYLLDITSADSEESKWVLRFPGVGTSEFINREIEANNAKLSSQHGLNVEVVWTHNDGRQLSEFFDGKPLSRMNSPENYLPHAATTLKKLHCLSPSLSTSQIDITGLFSTELITKKKPGLLEDSQISKIALFMENLQSIISGYKITKTFCHNDANPDNFLFKEKENDKSIECRLIDWEYSNRQSDALFDISYFLYYGKYTNAQRQIFLETYFDEITPQISAWIKIYEPVISWWVTLWAYTQIANDSSSCESNEYLLLAQEYLTKTLELIHSEEVKSAIELISSPLELATPIERQLFF